MAVNLRLFPDKGEALKKAAGKDNPSMQEAVRRAFSAYIFRRGEKSLN